MRILHEYFCNTLIEFIKDVEEEINVRFAEHSIMFVIAMSAINSIIQMHEC